MSDENVTESEETCGLYQLCRDCGKVIPSGDHYLMRQAGGETVAICIKCSRKPDEETFEPRRPQPMSIPGTRRPGSSMPEEQALGQMHDTAVQIDAKVRERKCESCGCMFAEEDIHEFKSPAGPCYFCKRCML